MHFSVIDRLIQEEDLYVYYTHIIVEEIRECQIYSCEAGPGR